MFNITVLRESRASESDADIVRSLTVVEQCYCCSEVKVDQNVTHAIALTAVSCERVVIQ